MSITRAPDGYVAWVAGLLEPIREATWERVLTRTVPALGGVEDWSYEALRRNVDRILPSGWQ